MQRGQVESLVDVVEGYGRLHQAVRLVVQDKDEVVDLCLVTLLAGGHVLAYGGSASAAGSRALPQKAFSVRS